MDATLDADEVDEALTPSVVVPQRLRPPRVRQGQLPRSELISRVQDTDAPVVVVRARPATGSRRFSPNSPKPTSVHQGGSRSTRPTTTRSSSRTTCCERSAPPDSTSPDSGPSSPVPSHSSGEGSSPSSPRPWTATRPPSS